MVNQVLYYALTILLAINLLSFVVVGIDKRKSVQNSRRISEQALFFWALGFGALGIYLGMFIFHHKTAKWYFQLGIPLLVALNIYLALRFIIFYLAS